MAIVLLVRNGIIATNGPLDGLDRFRAGFQVRGNPATPKRVGHLCGSAVNLFSSGRTS